MSTVDFGLMITPREQGRSIHEVMIYNQECIQRLKAGFTTLWIEDHLQWDNDEVLEALSTMGYLLGEYTQFRVGTLVLSQSYRNPALLAKMAANWQALSGGRVVIGVGAGWKEDEYRSYDYPFPPVKIRMEQLEDYVQILKVMWTSQPATFEGKHYSIHDAHCSPLPSPSIPLLIGGGGEQRTLAIVARYADWWNFNSCTIDEYARKLSILRQHCQQVGRDPSQIRLTYLSTMSISKDPSKVQRNSQKHYIAGNADEVAHELEQFRAIGVTHFIFRVLDLESLEQFVEQVVPHFIQRKELEGYSSFLDKTTPVFSPTVCSPPKKRACSILIQRSCTNVRPACRAFLLA